MYDAVIRIPALRPTLKLNTYVLKVTRHCHDSCYFKAEIRFDMQSAKSTVHRPPDDPCVECDNAHAQDVLAPDELLLLIQENIRTVRPSKRYSKCLIFLVCAQQ